MWATQLQRRTSRLSAGFHRMNQLKEIPVTDYNKFQATAIDPAALADEG
jgi:hypothetical protein